MGVGGGGEQQLGAVGSAAGDDDDVALERLGVATALDLDSGHGRARVIAVQPDGVGAGEQGDVRMLERRSDGDHLGVGLGVHDAREAVAVVTPHAFAVGHVALVEEDPARRVERV